MSINIDHLSVDELVTLNHRIIERLKMLESLEASQIDDAVSSWRTGKLRLTQW
jgi:hypothetical protein